MFRPSGSQILFYWVQARCLCLYVQCSLYFFISLTVVFDVISGPYTAVYSGSYRSNLITAQPTSTRLVTRAPADCVEPDSFGFVDESGKEHIAKISEGSRKAVYAALGKGDVARLKVEAASVA